MAFGKAKVQTASYTDENGGAGKDVFVVSKAGEKGTPVSVTFHMFPDTDTREETEVIAKEVGLKVKVRGQDSYRTCLVRSDNPHDTAIWEQINTIKANEELSETDSKELQKKLRGGLSRYVFFLNVFVYNDNGTGKVQVLKGGWEEVREDDAGNLSFWRFGKLNEYGGKTEYGMLRKKMKAGAMVQDPKKPLKRTSITDPNQLTFTRTISGVGLGKSYEYTVGLGELPDGAEDMPRYDLNAWAGDKGNGIWPNAAIEELMNGADFYETREKYGVVLYPELEKVETAQLVNALADSEEDDDELFSE